MTETPCLSIFAPTNVLYEIVTQENIEYIEFSVKD